MEKGKLQIRNSTAEFLIFTAQSGESNKDCSHPEIPDNCNQKNAERKPVRKAHGAIDLSRPSQKETVPC